MAELAPVEPRYVPGEDAAGEREAFLEACSRRCRCCRACEHCPCDGVTAGGLCDELPCGCDVDLYDDFDAEVSGYV